MGASSLLGIVRASENIKFTQETRGDIGVRFGILAKGLGEWAVRVDKGSEATNLRACTPRFGLRENASRACPASPRPPPLRPPRPNILPREVGGEAAFRSSRLQQPR